MEKWLEITTTIGCKNRCVYCPQDTLMRAYFKRSNIAQMNFDTFKKCIDKVPQNVEIHFSGMAEPWLNPNCTKMLLYAHNRGFKITVYTSLVGMSPLDIDRIKSVPFRVFVVHLPDKDGLTKIDVSDKHLEVVSKISESNIQNITYMSVGPVHPELKKLVGGHVSEYVPVSVAGHIKDVSGIRPPARRNGVITCNEDENRFYCNILLPNGDVSLCCMDYGIEHILGNLLYSDYTSLFDSEEFHRLQNGLKDDAEDILCRRCEVAVEICSK